LISVHTKQLSTDKMCIYVSHQLETVVLLLTSVKSK